MQQARQTIDVDVPPEAMYAVVTDFERYPEFLEHVLGCRIEAADPGRARVHFTVSIVKRFSYRLDMTLEAPNRVDWTLVDGELFEVNNGGWTIEGREGGGTRATYFIDVALGLFVPRAVHKRLVEVTLPRTLQQFADEARRRAGGSP